MKTMRNMINIDEELCDGCELCVSACAEGAIQVIDGKAKLVNEIYCDGLGACLGDCPTGALTIEQREAEDFDEEAAIDHVARIKQAEEKPAEPEIKFQGCPGSALKSFAKKEGGSSDEPIPAQSLQSQLGHWPVQLKLVPPFAPFLKGADILVCADCVPFAVPDFHSRYLKDKAVLVGCPKLDDLQYYREKLQEVFAEAKPKSLTVLRMEVPCCGGIESVAVEAAKETNPDLPVEVHIIGVRGEIRKAGDPKDEPVFMIGGAI